jgi:hypothetical protein
MNHLLFILSALILCASALTGTASARNMYLIGSDDQVYSFSERPRTQTLVTSEVRHGGFGSLIYGVTSINGEVVMLRGSRGAWILNLSPQHALHIGLASYRTTPDAEAVNWTRDDIERPEMRINYGGFEMEYVNRSFRLVHFGTQLLIGSGSVRYDNRNIPVDKTRDHYFVAQPGVNVFLNVTNWFRISAGAYYRYADNVNLEGTDSAELSGFSGILGLRFGRF